MSQPSPTNIFGKFASVVTLLGFALYFTGWIYRWSYFSFFQLEVTTLDLPPQSFLFVPLQIFFGSFSSLMAFLYQLFRTLVVALIAFIIIRLTLSFIQYLFTRLPIKITLWKAKILSKSKKNKRYFLETILRIINVKTIDFTGTLLNELIIVLGILMVLFFLAYHQGIDDARRDAWDGKSTLSAVTIVVPKDELGLGRQLGRTDNPSGFQIIGDVWSYQNLLGDEINKKRVWRLLLDHNGYFYLFRSFPEKTKKEDISRPVVLVIQGSLTGNQLVILSPKPY